MLRVPIKDCSFLIGTANMTAAMIISGTAGAVLLLILLQLSKLKKRHPNGKLILAAYHGLVSDYDKPQEKNS